MKVINDLVKQFNLVELKTVKNINTNKFYKDNRNYIWQLYDDRIIELSKPNPETFTMIANLNNMSTRIYTVQPMILYRENIQTVSPLFAEIDRVQSERTNAITTFVAQHNLTKLRSNIAGPFAFYRDNNNMIWVVNTTYNHVSPVFTKPAPTDYIKIAILNHINSSIYGIQKMVLI